MAAAERTLGGRGRSDAGCPNSERAALADRWPSEWCVDMPEVPSRHEGAAGAEDDAIITAIAALPEISLVTCVRQRVSGSPLLDKQEQSYALFPSPWGSPLPSPRSPSGSPRLVRQSSQRLLDTGALVQLSPLVCALQEAAVPEPGTPRSRLVAGTGGKGAFAFPPRLGSDDGAPPRLGDGGGAAAEAEGPGVGRPGGGAAEATPGARRRGGASARAQSAAVARAAAATAGAAAPARPGGRARRPSRRARSLGTRAGRAELAVFEPASVPSPADVCRLLGIQEVPDSCNGPGRLEPVPVPAALRLRELVVADGACSQELDGDVAGPAASVPDEEMPAMTCATSAQGLPATESTVPGRPGPEEPALQQFLALPAEPQPPPPPPPVGDGLLAAQADCWQQGAAAAVQLAAPAQWSPALELDEAPAVVDLGRLLGPHVGQEALQGVVPAEQAPAVVDVSLLLGQDVGHAAPQGGVLAEQAAPQSIVLTEEAPAVVDVGWLLGPHVGQEAPQGVVPAEQAPAVVDVSVLLGQDVGHAAPQGGVLAEQAAPQSIVLAQQAAPQSIVLAEQAVAVPSSPAGPVALRADSGLAVPRPGKAKLASISRPASSVLCAKEVIAPETHHTYAWLMNEIAVPRMQLGDLGGAYSQLIEANVLHMKLYGKFSGDAMYNLACCLSRGAAAPLGDSPGTPCDAGLPPFLPGASAAEVAEARLDLAVGMLESAVVAGYGDAANVLADADLQAIRSWRPERFAVVARRLAGEVVPLGRSAVAPDAGEGSLGALVSQVVACDPQECTGREDGEGEGWEEDEESDDGGTSTIAEQFADSWALFAESVRGVFGQSLSWSSILTPLVKALLDNIGPRLLGMRALTGGPPVGDCGSEPEPEDDEDDEDGSDCGSGAPGAVLATGAAEFAESVKCAAAAEGAPEEPAPAPQYSSAAPGAAESAESVKLDAAAEDAPEERITVEGTWCYGELMYHLRAEPEGGLRFDQCGDTGNVCGLLRPLGDSYGTRYQWYQGSLFMDQTQTEFGTIRLRLDEARAEVVSSFMAAGSTVWDNVIVARKAEPAGRDDDDIISI